MNAKRTAIYLLDIMILIVSAICMVLIYREVDNIQVQYPLLAVCLMIFLCVVMIEIKAGLVTREGTFLNRLEASALVLFGDNQREIQFWDLAGQTSLLIGKSTDKILADIDLSQTEYSATIEAQHAVLNYTYTGWYVENVSLRGDVSIRRPGKERQQLLTVGIPCKLLPGDELYIADSTVLSVK
ncbi:hypothetical protein DS742_07435 [Lacrimispora amygdalina]|uniref:FHA domain-containing protein n=1 Tax=Lacrimispora amygdalina TaxID=253257 RepID=A0A3E2NEZ9_9FIRM|nr:hypothetical protein [Clostridium indicum]RFZ79598.1 hypothetical protein DS742_07435 [Clostridium indicum]